MELDALKKEIKQLIIEECDKEDDLEWHEIKDDEALFGFRSDIGLDSLDALQLSLVLKNKYGMKVEGSKESRKHLSSVNAIAKFIVDNSPE